MLRKSLLPTFTGVAAGDTATSNLTLGQMLHVSYLELGDDGSASEGNADNVEATLANLCKDIRVSIDGGVQRTMTAVQLNQLNAINGEDYTVKTSGTAGDPGYRLYLPIIFAEIFRKNNAEVGKLAWNLNQINSAQIEVDLNTGLVAPTIKGFYEWEPADMKAGIGGICKWIRSSVPASGTEYDWPIVRKANEFLQSLHLFPTTDAVPRFVQKLKMTANGEDIQAALTNLQNQVIMLGRGLKPDIAAAPRFDWIADMDDPINNALILGNLSSLNAKVEWNAGANANMVVIQQRVGAPE